MLEYISGCTYLLCREAQTSYETHLIQELHSAFSKSISISRYGDLLYIPEATDSSFVPYWAQNVMQKPFRYSFSSISEAAQFLRSLQRNWASYAFTHFRRAQLIQESLPYVNRKPKSFPCTIPRSPIGMWTLLDERTLLGSCETSSFLPCGELQLIEDHENPPSRAYLKLQEALIRSGVFPQKGERCLDAGACPGGWTYVLTQLGAHVTAIDRAELAPRLMAHPNVTFIKHDAFTLNPEELGDFDWVCSDVICYPERLLAWIHKWLPHTQHMICTIKMQGEMNWNVVKEFSCIKNSSIVHLNYNKHELTWMYHASESPALV